MAAFYTPFLVDSVFSPNDPIKNSGFSDEFFPEFDQIYASSASGPHSSFNESSCLEQLSSSSGLPSVTERQSLSLSFTSMADRAEESGEQVTQVLLPLDKKRKSNHGSPSLSANSKEVKQVKRKKEKGSKEGIKNAKKKGENQATSEEPPKGYIHVRARRGQATDSHSLAERARREKISQKMKTLQALVPGCDKVAGKALMLDEIINYVQSLQNQVELLSMKLASLDPMVYIFGLMDHDTMAAFGTEVTNSNGTALLSMSTMQSATNSNSSSSSPPLGFAGATATNTVLANSTATAFPTAIVDSSTNSSQHEQKPNLPLQDARRSLWGLDDLQQHNIINQFGFGSTNNNLYYSFH